MIQAISCFSALALLPNNVIVAVLFALMMPFSQRSDLYTYISHDVDARMCMDS